MDPTLINRHRGDYLWSSFYLQGADGTFPTRNPATGVLLDKIPWRVSAVDVAVADARTAFDGWGTAQLEQRISTIRRFRDLLGARRDSIAGTMALEMGKVVWEARLECSAAVRAIDLLIDGSRTLLAESPHPSVRGTMRRRGLGVLGVVTPYPYPIFGPVQQLIPALLAGNTVVWKPSRHVPLTSQRLAEVFDAARIPPGALSVVQGPRDPVGHALVAHSDLDMVVAAGSAEMGDAVRARTASARPPWIQTGGKGWAMVCGDADLDRAAYEVVTGAFLTTGQRCNATSRVLIERRIAPAFLKRVVALTRSLKIGLPSNPEVFCGPLAGAKVKRTFETQLRRFARAGVEFPVEGGQGQLPATLRRRGQCFVAPAIVLVDGSLPPKVPLPEEVQGPLLVACMVDDIEAATASYNQHPYGLAAAIFTASEARFRYLASIIRAGSLNWNRGTIIASTRYPNAGLGRSGYGAEANAGLLYACTWPQSSLSSTGRFDPSYRVPGMDWPEEMDTTARELESITLDTLEDEATIVPNDDIF